MATTWLAHTPTTVGQKFLTGKGKYLHPRPMEITDSGRKVRFAGDPSSSTFSKDEAELVLDDLHKRAAADDDGVWMAIEDNRDDADLKSVFNVEQYPLAQFHDVHPDRARREHETSNYHRENNAKTVAWWRFKHPSLPLTAILTVIANDTRPYGAKVDKMQVTTSLIRSGGDHLSWRHQRYGQDHRATQVVIPDSALANKVPLGTNLYGDLRIGAQRLLELIRTIREELTQLPLWNPVAERDEMLDLVDTNVTEQLEDELVGYLDGEKTVREIADLYMQMLAKMRDLGIVLPPKNANAFLAALVGGERDALALKVRTANLHLGPDAEEETGTQGEHVVVMDLIGGTVAVECLAMAPNDPDRAAADWEAARLVAQLTGQEDELMAFARESVRREREEATGKHLAARREPGLRRSIPRTNPQN